MTKYFLHGGKEGLVSPQNTKFLHELTSGCAGEISFLCVYFAKDKNWPGIDWDVLFHEDRQRISAACPDKKINFLMAAENIEIFASQIVQADIILLRGGSTSLLRDMLRLLPNIEDLFKNKVVAGSSAGALVLSKYYYDGDLDSYEEGLGLVPIKAIVHWGPERYGKVDSLKKYGDASMEVYTIPEQEYLVFEKECAV